MNLSLPPKIRKLIEDRLRDGKYRTPEDVVAAALTNLDQQEQVGDFEPGELDQLLASGEKSGQALNGEEVFRELRELRQRGRTKAP
jgi:Arc/MetJ-type ribon-helix-helix transcriptional regulator